MAETLFIGQLAARTGRSIHAIRWYESQGLIPGVVRDGGRRRTYQSHHVTWLEFMDRLRSTGMSIAEMRKYTALAKHGSATLQQRRELLAAHRKRVEDTIAEWTRALRLIDGKLDYYEEWISTGERPKVSPSERAGLPQSPRTAKRRTPPRRI
jgi:DNA-binding transcriptional MerR regulator